MNDDTLTSLVACGLVNTMITLTGIRFWEEKEGGEISLQGNSFRIVHNARTVKLSIRQQFEDNTDIILPTVYKLEKYKQSDDENGGIMYQMLMSRLRNVHKNLTQVRIDQESLDKDKETDSLPSVYFEIFTKLVMNSNKLCEALKIEFEKLSDSQKEQAVIRAKNYYQWYKREQSYDSRGTELAVREI